MPNNKRKISSMSILSRKWTSGNLTYPDMDIINLLYKNEFFISLPSVAKAKDGPPQF